MCPECVKHLLNQGRHKLHELYTSKKTSCYCPSAISFQVLCFISSLRKSFFLLVIQAWIQFTYPVSFSYTLKWPLSQCSKEKAL